MTQTSTPLNFKTAPGHQVLAAAGKKALRPGGYTATEQLFAWADFQPGETVLALAASYGYSALALAQRYGVSAWKKMSTASPVLRSLLLPPG